MFRFSTTGGGHEGLFPGPQAVVRADFYAKLRSGSSHFIITSQITFTSYIKEVIYQMLIDKIEVIKVVVIMS